MKGDTMKRTEQILEAIDELTKEKGFRHPLGK